MGQMFEAYDYNCGLGNATIHLTMLRVQIKPGHCIIEIKKITGTTTLHPFSLLVQELRKNLKKLKMEMGPPTVFCFNSTRYNNVQLDPIFLKMEPMHYRSQHLRPL